MVFAHCVLTSKIRKGATMSILTNLAALKSLYHINKNEGEYTTSVERVSSGKRVNNAGDDAAGASIINRMTSQVQGMSVAIRNAGDAISMAQVAEGALDETTEILHRLREIAVQSANGTYSGANRVALNAEVVALKTELLRIAESTKFNDVKLLNGQFQDTTFAIGYDESPGHTHSLSIESVKPDDLGMWTITSEQENTATLKTNGMGSYGAAANIDTASDHLFETGDIVTYEQGPAATSVPVPGLVDGKSYKVTVVDSDSFTLTHLDGTAVKYGAISNFGTPSNAKFHLQSISNAPTVGLSKGSYAATGGTDQAAPASEVLKTEDITVHGHVGSSEVQLRTGMTALEIANAVSNMDSLTGVRASAVTNARITVSPSNNTDDKHVLAFDLYGMNTDSPVKISATIGFGTGDEVHSADLSDLRDKINGFTGTTGIYAKLSSDKSYIDIKSPDGYDIVIDNVDMPTDTGTTLTQALVNVGGANTSDTITSALAHGFQVGDMVKLTDVHEESGLVGIDMETTYFVKTAPTATEFTLATGSPDGTTVNITTTNDGHLEFTKLEKTLNLQTLDRDLNVQGGKVKLMDKDIELQGSGVGAVMTGVASSAANALITCSNAHRLQVGDIVKYTSGADLITGLTDGQFYKVKAAANATTFTLENLDGTDPTYGGSMTGGTFSKVVSNENSLRLTGEVQFESAYTFTVVPAVQDSLFRAAPPAANLNKVSDLDVLTVEKSHKFLTALDGAIKRIDAERGDLGATMNRMQHTIDNLSNVIVGTKSARGRIEDADMAAETASLAKNQILQQAATAMLGQANQSMQTILTLLR